MVKKIKQKRIDPNAYDPVLTRRLKDWTSNSSVTDFAKKYDIYYRDLLAYIKIQKIELKSIMLTPEGKETIALYYLNNPEKTQKEIINRFGISETTLRRIIKQYNIPKRKKYGKSKTQNSREKKAIQLIKLRELTNQEIAEKTKLSSSTIAELRNQLGCPRKKDITLKNIPTSQINQLIKDNPNDTIQQLADKLGWSYTRVSELFRENPKIKYKKKKTKEK